MSEKKQEPEINKISTLTPGKHLQLANCTEIDVKFQRKRSGQNYRKSSGLIRLVVSVCGRHVNARLEVLLV
jgi:hypothetical protein